MLIVQAGCGVSRQNIVPRPTWRVNIVHSGSGSRTPPRCSMLIL